MSNYFWIYYDVNLSKPHDKVELMKYFYTNYYLSKQLELNVIRV